jgi:hypothetical protein
MDTLKPTCFERIASLLRRFDVWVLLISLTLYMMCLILFVGTLGFFLVLAFLAPVIMVLYGAIVGLEDKNIAFSTIFKLFTLSSLPILFLHLVFIAFPVYWSGLHCDPQVGNSCYSVRDIPFHTHKLLPYETMRGLVILLDAFVFLYLLFFSYALLLRVVMIFRSLPRNTALFRFVGLLVLQMIVFIAINASLTLATWYE